MVTVTFNPIGLPSGVTYLVSMAGMSKNGISPHPVNFTIPTGNYTYSYSAIPCGYPNIVQKITVASNQTLPIMFTKSATLPCSCQKLPTSTTVKPVSPATSTVINPQTYINYGLLATFLGAAGILGYKFYKLK